MANEISQVTIWRQNCLLFGQFCRKLALNAKVGRIPWKRIGRKRSLTGKAGQIPP